VARRRTGRGRNERERPAHRITFFLVTWVLLSALYVVLVFKTQFEEYVAGVICGLVSALGVDMVRTQGSVRFAPGLGWVPGLARVPGEVLTDTSLLIRVLWRVLVRREVVRGQYRVVPFKGARGNSPEAAGRRAIAKWVGSIAPNTLVVGFDDHRDRVLVHQLVKTEEPPRCDPWERR
jgi:multisubunit Na+/H+ antiporter MnhE subunit